jgi:hypothetical protein
LRKAQQEQEEQAKKHQQEITEAKIKADNLAK